MSNRFPDYPITRLPDSLAALLLALATIAAYASSFGAGFPLDNTALILRDARVHESTRANLDLILSHSYWWPVGESGLYRPLTTLSYLFNYAILGNGEQPFGYHVVNLGLHLVNVWLVYALTRRVLRSNSLAVAIAAIWAVHPLGTEAVTNIVGRADLLAALAVLGGLLMYIRSTEATGNRRIVWLVGLALITTVGVFAKESAVVIVAVIALYALSVRSAKASRSIETGSRSIGKTSRSTEKSSRTTEKSPRSTDMNGARGFSRALIALAVPLLLLWYQRNAVLGPAPAAEFPFVDNPIAGAGFVQGRLTALAVLARYLLLIVWPLRLSADYSFGQIPLATGTLQDWIAWLAVAAVAAGCVLLWRRDRTAFFFAAFAFVTFLPAANLLFPTGTIMAERVMYLPAVGIIAVLVMFARTIPRPIAIPLVAVLVAALAVRTFIRNRDWKDDVTLWTATVHTSPQSFKAHRGLAEAIYETNPSHTHMDRVAAEIGEALTALDPLPAARNDAKTYRMAGGYYLEFGDALRGGSRDSLPPDAARAYERSVSALERAITIVESRRTASAADTYRLLSAAHQRLRQHDAAIDAANRARALEPFSVIGYQQSAAAYLSAERGDDAAITLMTGMMITDDRALRDELVDLYRQGLDPAGCAVVNTPDGAAINPACATVRRHICAATAQAVEIDMRAGRGGEAQRLKASAARQFQCP